MDRADFENFMREHQAAVYGYCRGLTRHREDADDLFQQTFVTAFAKFEEIESDRSPRAYLLTLASNLWRNERRKFARRRRIAPAEELDSQLLENIPGEDSPEGELLQREQSRAVRAAINRLPAKFKIPLMLYYAGNLSVEEIAVRCGCPPGTVKSRLFHGRAKLKTILEKEKLRDE